MFYCSVSFFLYHYQNIFICHRSYLGSQVTAHYSFFNFFGSFYILKSCEIVPTHKHAVYCCLPMFPSATKGSRVSSTFEGLFPKSPPEDITRVSSELNIPLCFFVVLTHVHPSKTSQNQPKPKCSKLPPQ